MPNCKAGDLAIVVKSMAGNEGKIVRCIKFAPGHYFFGGIGCLDSWEIDPALPGTLNRPAYFAPDAWLKPIRGESETEPRSTIKELEYAIQGEA